MKIPWVLVLLWGLLVAGCSNQTSSAIPIPTSSPGAASIRHVVILLQENRSFNNLFMGFPGATTSSVGACKPVVIDSEAVCTGGGTVRLHRITLETSGMPAAGKDMGHSHADFETEFDGGKMDGFDGIRLGTIGNGPAAKFYPYAYVARNESKPYWDMAKDYALADRMFSTATTDSFVAHQQIIAGTARLSARESLVDTPSVPLWGCDAPPGTVTGIIRVTGRVESQGGPFPCFTQYATMADVLNTAGLSWKFYVASENEDFSGDVWNGFDAIAKVRCKRYDAKRARCFGYGADWAHVTSPNTTIFEDVKRGTLPNVSWVIPTLADSDHPASGSNTGPSWVASIVNAIGKSSYWKSTAIVIVWDDWGGFYDRVPPPQVSYTSLGIRVPAIVISPWSKHGYVSKTRYDFGSILKYIETNFGTGNLGASDVTANSIGDVFDFNQRLRPFRPIAAPHAANYFLSHRTFARPKAVLKAAGGAAD